MSSTSMVITGVATPAWRANMPPPMYPGSVGPCSPDGPVETRW